MVQYSHYNIEGQLEAGGMFVRSWEADDSGQRSIIQAYGPGLS